MKKTIFITIIVALGVVLAAKLGMFSAIFMFFLIGIIPGTQIIIPANIMLILISTTMCGILFYIIGRDVLHYLIVRHADVEKRGTKNHLPKQRFSEI